MLKSLKNCTTVLPSYCFITLREVELENIRLSVSEILGVFVESLSADVMYTLHNRKTLPKWIQRQLSKKQKIFALLFAAYLKSTSNGEHFEKKDDPHWQCIFKISDSEIWG